MTIQQLKLGDSASHSKTIIHDFSCEAQPGQTIAIVGPTGAGKTKIGRAHV